MSTTTRTSFYYDPARQGYDTALWKGLSGTVVLASILIPDTDPGDVDIDIPFETFTISEGLTITNTIVLMDAVNEALSLSETVTAVRT
jgi:hypothetical protein